MLKKNLVKKLSKDLDVSEKEAHRLLMMVAGAIIDGCLNDGSVVIRGFGTFKVSERRPRTGTVPGTGEKIKYPSSRTIRFKPGKSVKADLNRPQ